MPSQTRERKGAIQLDEKTLRIAPEYGAEKGTSMFLDDSLARAYGRPISPSCWRVVKDLAATNGMARRVYIDSAPGQRLERMAIRLG